MIEDRKPIVELENIKVNEEIARKFFEIEVSILSINNVKDLFEKLLLSIEEKFGIPHVWISIINGSEVSRILEAIESSELLSKRLNLIGKNTFLELIKDENTPVLVNEGLKSYYKLLPKKQKYFVKSLAIAPLVLDGTIIGSLNLGDYSGSRFEPNMDTYFLSHLSVKISICLSNVSVREKLKQLATRDPLTSLLNRREMENTLEREFSRTNRYNIPLSLIFIDFDGFKMVNDTHGHNCGDTYLKYVASQMKKVVRKEDIVARFGGDEFVIILPNQTSDNALMVTQRLHDLFQEQPMKYGNTTIPISMSCGIASTEDAGVDNPATLLSKADKRLYKAKKQKSRRSVL
jgi:diguanylate cyclase (GGDEF)-like protein